MFFFSFLLHFQESSFSTFSLLYLILLWLDEFSSYYLYLLMCTGFCLLAFIIMLERKTQRMGEKINLHQDIWMFYLLGRWKRSEVQLFMLISCAIRVRRNSTSRVKEIFCSCFVLFSSISTLNPLILIYISEREFLQEKKKKVIQVVCVTISFPVYMWSGCIYFFASPKQSALFPSFKQH